MIFVGRIVGRHGTRGALKVETYSDVAGRFQPGSSLFIGFTGGDFIPVTVEEGLYAGHRMILRFKEKIPAGFFQHGNDCWLAIEDDTSPLPVDGTYYHHQLIGLSVIEGGRLMGRVCAVVEHPSYDYLEVEKSGRRALVPFVKNFIRRIDLKAGKVFTNCPAGLWDELEN